MTHHSIVIGRTPRGAGQVFLDANVTPAELREQIRRILSFVEPVRVCTFAPHALDLWRDEVRSLQGFSGDVYSTVFVHEPAPWPASLEVTDVPVARYGAPEWMDNFSLADLYVHGNLAPHGAAKDTAP